MDTFCLMTDSSCDLADDVARELELVVAPLSIHMGSETYRNWLDGREIGFHAFYERIREGALPTSSAVSVGDFEAAMEKALSEGQDILCLAFSSGLSATCQSAVIAAEHLRERFPDRKIAVVDTLQASAGQGLLVYLCGKQRQAGKTLEEVRAFAEETKGKIRSWFTVEDLNHLKRGGRINAATALFGTMLAIKPLLRVDKFGKLVNVEKARGRRAAIQSMVDHMAEDVYQPEEQTIFITHGDCLEEAEGMAEEIRRRFHVKDVKISYVGPVIGSHTGAGVLTLFYLGK